MELASMDKPSMKNIYESNHLNHIISDEREKARKNYEMSKYPMKSGVVPQPAFSSMFSPVSDEVSLLSGEAIDKSKFTHNNMQPFIKGNVTQNVERFTSQLDNNTGVNKLYQGKKEVINQNTPQNNVNNINGAKIVNDFLKDRLTVSKVMNNVLPFKQQNIGPGLNKGYSTEGTGGFQQIDTREYALPKSIDELRSKINQKSSNFEVPIVGPAKKTEQRAVVMPLKKNRPETTYSQDIGNWFKSRSIHTKDAVRSELAIKSTHRQTSHKEYKGAPKYVNIQGVADNDDYGKSKIIVYDNERNTTQTATPIANLTSSVKAAINPLLDVMKLSLKEYLVNAPRAAGNTSIQMPNKLTVQDKDDNMRTTVKETTIHDSDTLNLAGPDASYSALHDTAKTTVKETTVHDSENLNLTGPDASYSAIQDDAKKTLRETLPIQDTTRNIGKGTYRVYMYNPEIAKRTMKETTINGKAELGFIGGVINSILGAYATTDIDLRNSHKQFTVDNENIGIAKATCEYRQVSREAEENAEIDGAREQLLIDAGGTPNPGRMNIPIDKSNVSMKFNKLIEDSYAAREKGNIGVIYQTRPEITECNLTRDTENANAFADRLDGSVLKSLEKNDFNININPIKV